MALPGGQAQYVRVPKAGGTLFRIPSSNSPETISNPELSKWTHLADTSLLLLSDILPTGCFAAIQTLEHPKLAPMLTKLPFPRGSLTAFPTGVKMSQLLADSQWPPIESQDCELTLAVIGLGPVGIVSSSLCMKLTYPRYIFLTSFESQCAIVSLLDILSSNQLHFKVVAIDILESRRAKVKAVYNTLPQDARGQGTFIVADPNEAKDITSKWTSGVGCNAVLEVWFTACS